MQPESRIWAMGSGTGCMRAWRVETIEMIEIDAANQLFETLTYSIHNIRPLVPGSHPEDGPPHKSIHVLRAIEV